mmetsp:Transcript_19616/g.33746  ORF Transcript_19616/g.33746 Transcript_19616/m.33746 type:complete len:80 (-) Transcript_19616:172-411(-)
MANAGISRLICQPPRVKEEVQSNQCKTKVYDIIISICSMQVCSFSVWFGEQFISCQELLRKGTFDGRIKNVSLSMPTYC